MMNVPPGSLGLENRADYSANGGAASWRRVRVPAAMAGLRLDLALAKLLPEYSRNRLQGWMRAGQVLIDGVRAEPKRRLWGGETIDVASAPEPRELAQQPEVIPLAILFEDDAVIVLDKPAGLVVHPGSGNWNGTLLNALLHHAPQLAGVPRAGIVHRLDKETSGLLVVAKTLEAQTDLVRQLQAHSVRRQYLALLRGRLSEGGTIDAAIGRHPTQRTRMAVVAGGRPARTHYRVVRRFGHATLVECTL